LADPILQVRAAYQSASLHAWFDGDLGSALAQVRRGLDVARSIEDRALRVEGHIRASSLLYNLGDLAGAETQLVECGALLREFESLRFEAQMTFFLAVVKYYRGDLQEAERLGTTALAWLERTGERYYELQNRRSLALCAVARADLTVAEERLREALPLAFELGGWIVVEIYRCLIDVLLRQDRVADAAELADVALRDLPVEDTYARAAGLMIEVSLASAESRATDARRGFEEALPLLEQRGDALDLGEARLAYSRALRRLGDTDDAVAQLQGARGDLEQIGALGLVVEIDRELAEMGEEALPAGPLASS
jgi:tetratricopeptide (TPR) repeat protein